jgi:hypothetical protein
MHDAGPFGDDTILHLVAPFLLLKTPTNGAGFVFCEISVAVDLHTCSFFSSTH